MDGDSIEIPFPVDGVNFFTPPYALAQTEAREITNYFVYKFGLRRRGNLVVAKTFNATDGTSPYLILPYQVPGSSFIRSLISTEKRIFRGSSYSDTAPTNKMGAIPDLTGPITSYCEFNGHIFLVNGLDAGLDYTISSETLANTGFSGLSFSTVSCVFQGKRRLYAIIKDTNIIAYGALDQVTGAALTQRDFSSVFHQNGTMAWGTTWSVNQGIENQELFVFGSDSGEIVVFSGSYPDASDWQIAARIKIDKPSSGALSAYKFGQDVLIATTSGIISLKDAIAALSTKTPIFTISDKLGTYGTSASNSRAIGPMFKMDSEPFLVCRARYVNAVVTNLGAGTPIGFAVFNHQSPAWSLMAFDSDDLALSAGSPVSITTIGVVNNVIMFGTDSGKLCYIDPTNPDTRTTMGFIWKTGFLKLGKACSKIAKAVHLYTQSILTSVITNSASVTGIGSGSENIFSDSYAVFPSTSSTFKDTQVSNASLFTPIIQRFEIGAEGQYLSVNVQNNAGDSGRSDILGLELFYTLGGGAF